MGNTATIIRRELPHLTPLFVDGAIGVLCPTLMTFKVGAMALIKSGDASFASWSLLVVCDCGVAALTALGAFRSKAFGTWQEGKRQRDATALMLPGKTDPAKVDPEGHLR